MGVLRQPTSDFKYLPALAHSVPMKTEWQFLFETRGFRFGREHKYLLKPQSPISLGGRPAELIEPFVRITPEDDKKPPPFVEQVGSLFITLPYSAKETRDYAIFLSQYMRERINFQQGDFRIQWGLIIYKRIAETEEEEREFGDKIYGIEAHLEEVLPVPSFDSTKLTQQPSGSQNIALISQFNEAKRDKSVVSQFLGYFRIIESIYNTSTERGSLKQILLRSARLHAVYDLMIKDGSFEVFVSELVEVRHQCAHLRLAHGFGYAPNDPAIESKVKPLLPLIAAIARQSIIGTEGIDTQTDPPLE
jgi:hypothetical protein